MEINRKEYINQLVSKQGSGLIKHPHLPPP